MAVPHVDMGEFRRVEAELEQLGPGRVDGLQDEDAALLSQAEREAARVGAGHGGGTTPADADVEDRADEDRDHTEDRRTLVCTEALRQKRKAEQVRDWWNGLFKPVGVAVVAFIVAGIVVAILFIAGLAQKTSVKNVLWAAPAIGTLVSGSAMAWVGHQRKYYQAQVDRQTPKFERACKGQT